MKLLKVYNRKDLTKRCNQRPGEIKCGEKIQVVSHLENLEQSNADVVLVGIAEDIGVRANYGRPGTSSAWQNFLCNFLNQQHNRFLDATRIVLLGEIDTAREMEKASNLDPADPHYHEKLGDLVGQVDKKVSAVVRTIIMAGKTPVLVGGGHNNAYGNLRGASEASGTPVNALNIDAHTDLRRTDYRHSGNGFSYAIQEGLLDKYAVFGLHHSYTPEYILKGVQDSDAIQLHFFEDLFRNRPSFFQKSLEHVNRQVFGLELDCDSIAYFPSSAVSPTGFSLDEVRQLVKTTAREKNCVYLHICEAIASEDYPTGKALSILVGDFIKNKEI